MSRPCPAHSHHMSGALHGNKLKVISVILSDVTSHLIIDQPWPPALLHIKTQTRCPLLHEHVEREELRVS